jgi:hypothetical protein
MTTALDNARKIEAALELIRERSMAIEPETLELACVCAVEDEPYKLCFTKQASGLFRLKESVKLIRNGEASSRTFGHVPASTTLHLDQLESTVFPCAWCGNRSFHFCKDACGSFVCGGLIKGGTFHCRRSCGASWVGVPLKSISVERKQFHQVPMEPPNAPASMTTPSAPRASDKLLLGPGVDLRRLR